MQHDLEVFSEAIHIDSGPALRKPPLDFVSGRSGKSEDISLMKRRGKNKIFCYIYPGATERC